MRRSAIKLHLCFVAALGLCFFQPTTAAHAQVRAETGGIALGGSVFFSRVISGVPQKRVDELVREAKRPLEELTTQQRENIVLLKEKLDLNERQVRAALAILGENDIPPEQLAAKLVEIAASYKALLQSTLSAQPADGPKLVALKTDTQNAIYVGELAKADSLLADLETEQRGAVDHLNAAETAARRGEIALTRLRYREAATHFANAAAVFPQGSAHEDKRIIYLGKEASALSQQGDELGDNDALRSAIERFRRMLEFMPRERAPLDWARTQNNLGNALRILGERETGTAKLDEAVAIFREVLIEQARERVPLDWAKTLNSLGEALMRLGEREIGTAKLEEAAVAFRETLKVWTREREPQRWARTQNTLGWVLYRIAMREGRTARTAKLEEAIVAHNEALKEQTQEREPLDWARTQNSLGAALEALGRSEEAIAAYREALKERTRERVPLEWAIEQNNLGISLFSLGERESGTAKLEEAVAAYREALKEYTRERVPLEWARSFGNEGIALMLLAERRRDAAMAKAALNQINEAFETMRDGGNALSAAYYERQLPRARAIVARLSGR